MKLGFGVMPFRVSAASTSESTVAINDDDDPEVTVSFGASSYTVPEGGAIEVSVTLSADPERDVTIPVAKANQNGASDQDHSGIPASVAFGPGETEKKFTVNGTQDDVDDNDESVKLTFGTLPTRVTKGSMDETVVNITDDDVPFVKVDFAHGTDTVLEGYNLGIKVVLDVDPERTVTIPIVATEYDGASHHDYSVPGSVTFKSGETQAYPIFDAVHDDIDEDDERVVLTFRTPLPHRVTVGNPGMIDITITDDVVDGSPIQVSFRNGRHEVDEGESADLTVVLSKAADADLTIQLEEIHFDNIEASDYSGVPRNVQFARGDTEATFTVTAVDDSLAERTETLAIRFQNLPSIVRVGTIFGTDVVIKRQRQDRAGTQRRMPDQQRHPDHPGKDRDDRPSGRERLLERGAGPLAGLHHRGTGGGQRPRRCRQGHLLGQPDAGRPGTGGGLERRPIQPPRDVQAGGKGRRKRPQQRRDRPGQRIRHASVRSPGERRDRHVPDQGPGQQRLHRRQWL